MISVLEIMIQIKRMEYQANLIKLIFVVLFVGSTLLSYGQQSDENKDRPVLNDSLASHSKELQIPDFVIATIQDSTEFSSARIPKKGILLIKYFSPGCSHCQEEAEMYFTKKDSLANIRTIWLSGVWAELKDVKDFAEEYHLDQFNPIAIGKESSDFLASYYQLKTVPFAAVYKDNKLIKEYREAVDFDELVAINYGMVTPEPLNPEEGKE